MAKKQPTKTRDTSNHPYVANYPPLRQWLDKHGARCMWQVPSQEKLSDADYDWVPQAYIECWIVGKRPCIILVRGDKMGWEIYTDGNTNKIDETFADAERRLGLEPTPPCGGHVERTDIPCARPKGHHGDCSVV